MSAVGVAEDAARRGIARVVMCINFGQDWNFVCEAVSPLPTAATTLQWRMKLFISGSELVFIYLSHTSF